jgi:hypothetical protein
MKQPPKEISTQQVELLVLRAVCQGTPQGSVREAASRILADYVWREPVHQAMFKCLTSIRHVKPDYLRSEILACLTRRGFPDVEVEYLFQPRAISKEEVRGLILQLTRPA